MTGILAIGGRQRAGTRARAAFGSVPSFALQRAPHYLKHAIYAGPTDRMSATFAPTIQSLLKAFCPRLRELIPRGTMRRIMQLLILTVRGTLCINNDRDGSWLAGWVKDTYLQMS